MPLLLLNAVFALNIPSLDWNIFKYALCQTKLLHQRFATKMATKEQIFLCNETHVYQLRMPNEANGEVQSVFRHLNLQWEVHKFWLKFGHLKQMQFHPLY